MKDSTKETIEILGIFGVIASLVFVGMQLQLDRKVAVAEQYFNRTESTKEDLRAKLTSSAFSKFVDESWATGGRPIQADWEIFEKVKDGTMSASSAMSLIYTLRLSIIGYDNLYFQYKQGLLDEETWNSFRSDLKSSMSKNELRREVYLMSARPSIRPLVNEIIKEIESEQQSAE